MSSRHWRQHFDGNADFIYRRPMKIDTENGPKTVYPGEMVDKDQWGGAKLRRLWESNYIELADFRPNPIHNPHESAKQRKLRRTKTGVFSDVVRERDHDS